MITMHQCVADLYELIDVDPGEAVSRAYELIDWTMRRLVPAYLVGRGDRVRADRIRELPAIKSWSDQRTVETIRGVFVSSTESEFSEEAQAQPDLYRIDPVAALWLNDCERFVRRLEAERMSLIKMRQLDQDPDWFKLTWVEIDQTSGTKYVRLIRPVGSVGTDMVEAEIIGFDAIKWTGYNDVCLLEAGKIRTVSLIETMQEDAGPGYSECTRTIRDWILPRLKPTDRLRYFEETNPVQIWILVRDYLADQVGQD